MKQTAELVFFFAGQYIMQVEILFCTFLQGQEIYANSYAGQENILDGASSLPSGSGIPEAES